MIDAVITRIARINVTCERSTIVANFDVRVGDFKIRNAQIREDHTDGRLFVGLPGRHQGGISLSHGATRDAVCLAALEAYHAER
ncbi:hypothetical protein [Sinorhizobium medicae]|uniref:hypothetical protein n=1 Tax=Sinorhizobium medicae TaxID=110321 RepID=UPI0003FEE55D|nr:hypothetical protein [Sinorhizobium medicae]RVQ66173.1 hypothetical protein CN244_20235 [Sinorhizobium medicae]